MKTLTRLNFVTLNSTQTWAKEHLDQIPKNGWLAVTAEQQTAGIGTQEKLWHSPPGNIYVTLATQLPVQTLLHKVQFAQITALVVVQALEQLGFTPRLKWVNDVMLRDKKVAGVLAEIVAHDQYLIIGVGINVNLEHVPTTALNEIITSLFLETKKVFAVEEVLALFLKFFLQAMDDYFRDRNPQNLIQQIQQRLTVAVGETAVVFSQGKVMVGEFLGLDFKGQVRLQVDNRVVTINQGSMIAQKKF